MVGQAIAFVLSEVAGLNVLGVCASLAELNELIDHSQPRLLVLDVELDGECYQEAAALVRQRNPEVELLFVTALAEQFMPPADLAPLTIGVVNKAHGWDQLLAVVQRWWVQRSDMPCLPGCDQQLRAIERLTPREQRVVLELGCGLLNKEIAARLQISVATVESYRKSVASKLGVSGAELVRLATLHRALSWEGGSPPAA